PVLSNIDDSDYLLRVFDRTGTIIFETRDATKGWNGSHTGEDYYLRTDVYAWEIVTKNLISLEKVEFEGVVTVIR
ncbi:MAG: hypothetical protein AAGC47_09135, partial [Bacteroidota bacterium]